ncbi:hypothetical protein ACUH95_04630 [Dermabacteraceae bacterium P13101]
MGASSQAANASPAPSRLGEVPGKAAVMVWANSGEVGGGATAREGCVWGFIAASWWWMVVRWAAWRD